MVISSHLVANLQVLLLLSAFNCSRSCLHTQHNLTLKGESWSASYVVNSNLTFSTLRSTSGGQHSERLSAEHWFRCLAVMKCNRNSIAMHLARWIISSMISSSIAKSCASNLRSSNHHQLKCYCCSLHIIVAFDCVPDPASITNETHNYSPPNANLEFDLCQIW